MTGTIELFNPQRGLAAAKFSDGYVVFEILESFEPKKGDEIAHENFFAMGGQEFYSTRMNGLISVYVENVVATPEQASKLMK